MLFAILCFLPLPQIWSDEFFLSTSNRGAQIWLTIQKILGNFTKGNAMKILPHLLCHKTLCNEIELCSDQYLSVHRLLNLLPFGNLSCSLFFSVDLHLRHKRPMDITGAVAENPRFHHKKTVL